MRFHHCDPYILLNKKVGDNKDLQDAQTIWELLYDAGALEIECEPIDLDNPIHPLFEEKNWVGISPDAYAKIVPAVQLASLWITEKKMLDWFFRLLTGDLIRGTDGRTELNMHSTTEDHRDHLVEGAVQRMFIDGCDRTSIVVSDTTKGTCTIAGMLVRMSPGEIQANPINPRIYMDYSEERSFHTTVIIAKELLETLDIPLTQCQLRRVLFSLAIVLVHEVTHAFGVWAGKLSDGEHGYEPYMFADEEVAELGLSWECNILGGTPVVAMMGGRDMDRTTMSTQCRDPDNRLEYNVRTSDVDFHFLPMKSINLWFIKTTWDRIREEGHHFMRAEASRWRFVREPIQARYFLRHHQKENVKEDIIRIERDGEIVHQVSLDNPPKWRRRRLLN
ncbi:hypothetical protein BDV95DRAFT_592014 [Massariosphaeria phaeospora]|uniref:Uncharacterized protein n=1 Tax=Massariosphaeria phaeospora TaxID=100035 RepID=A0A7C8IBG3_9PLEO|nr:hypothetical protein BDV95DRAFT_592014 [Massariosphaeria phaeospora]